MDADQAMAFAKALGSTQVKVHGQWVTGTCPLAPFTHKNGKDSNPSFGVSIRPGEHSNFNCYACRSGTAEELLQQLEMYWHQQHGGSIPLTPGAVAGGVQEFIWNGNKVDFHLARQLLNEELKVMPLPGYAEFSVPKTKPFEEWPSYFIDSFPPAENSPEARTYLHSRMVTDEEMVKWNLRWDYQKRMVVFPYFNVYGRLAGARGRCIDSGVVGWKKHFDYSWNGSNNSGLVWFNEQSLQLPGPVVVVEGQFDALRVAKVWPKVIACLTAKPTPAKLLRLLQTDRVIQIPDNDGPNGTGGKTVEVYRNFCAGHNLPYHCLYIPLPPGDSKIDPGECHPDFLQELLLPFA